jgi:DNA-binding FrmR family transcriptional regulator
VRILAVEEKMNFNYDHDCESCSTKTSRHSIKIKQNLEARMNSVEGQIRGIKDMVEKDVYCGDVFNQIASVHSALNSVGKILLKGHLKTCVIEWTREGASEVIDDLLITMNKLMRQ